MNANQKKNTLKQLISIIKRELEPLAIRKRNKLVVTPLESKVVVNLDVVN